MKYEIIPSGGLAEVTADAIVEGLYQEDQPKIGQGYLPEVTTKAVLAELRRREFDAKEGDVYVLPLLGFKQFKYLIVIGLGKKNNYDANQLRAVGAKAIKAANGYRAQKIVFHPDWLRKAKDLVGGIQALVEGIELGGYHFASYRKRTAAEQQKKHKAEEIVLMAEDRISRVKIEKGLELGKLFSEATILARDMVNTPSMDMHPEQMVSIAQSLAARGTNVTCKVFDKAGMEKLGMKASLAVGQGSKHEPRFVHLVYKPKQRSTKKIALIGKGLTFDSGGLSLKPADHMTDMKIDMAGAAAVIGVFKALPLLKPRVEVHGLFIAAENMPGGGAYRPGDVVAALDGTTIEVENTDAEGRITLADALSYAALRIKPQAMVDLATLTGAVIVALGSDISGLFCSNKELKTALVQAAGEAGETVWELPLYQPYKEQNKSKIADIRNVGGRPGGSITAALFLEKFTHDVPWAHIDVAGPVYAEKESKPEWVNGGTGWGVRLLLNYLRNL
ncbi:MAG: leucyl aminopeptidase [Patescibacteria group bacterium]|nr:leucyl aminopeptidase [Patescibacteria group bacterium]